MDHVVGLADPERLRALLATGLLDSPAEESFDRLTRLLVRELGVPTALVALVDDQREFFKSQVGVVEPWASRRGTPLSHSLSQHVVTGDQALVVEDARTDHRVSASLAVEELGCVAYAGAPVRGLDGRPLGSLCAIDTAPRAWTSGEVALVQELADVASELVALRTAAVATRAAVLDLSHEVRTRLATLSLEASSITGPAGQALHDGLSTMAKAVTSALRELEQAPRGHERAVPVAEVLDGVVARATGDVVALHAEDLSVSAPPAELGAVLDALVHVLRSSGNGPVRLSASAVGEFVRIRAQDDSESLPDDVVRRVLARADNKDADVTGSLAERATTALGGRLVLSSTAPTTFELLLPQG